MKNRTRKIPTFHSEKEEARFWAKHSLLEFWDDTEEIDHALEVNPKLLKRIRERARKRLLSIRLEGWRIDRAKTIARKKGVPYQTLLRHWIARGMEAERA